MTEHMDSAIQESDRGSSIMIRQMRKGTKSCLPCRKRKIRCSYAPGDQNECLQCYSRGTECVDQRAVSPLPTPARKRNVRERVTRLESAIASMRQELKAEQLQGKRAKATEERPSNSIEAVVRAPSTAFHLTSPAQVLSSFVARPQAIPSSTWPLTSNAPPNAWSYCDSILPPLSSKEAKDLQVHQALVGILPQGDELQVAIQRSNTLWEECREKRIGSAKHFITLEAFITYAVNKGSPYQIAEIAQMLAFFSEDPFFTKVVVMVDRLILSDSDYMNSLEGLHLAILNGHLYSNVGRTYQAWRTWRKAITDAQFQGLHKNRPSLVADVIWWSLHTLDRFASLMLVTPYAVADAHCRMTMMDKPIQTMSKTTSFGYKLQLAFIAGRVIDHLQRLGDYNTSTHRELHQLGAELTQFALETGTEAWLVESSPPENDSENAKVWRETLINQLSFYQVYYALYFPYMIRASESSQYHSYGQECLVGCRKFLQRYHQLRQSNAGFLLKIRAFDSIACAATITLILGLWTGINILEDQNGDLSLVERSLELFQFSSTEIDEDAAMQSYLVLKRFMETRSLLLSMDNKRKEFTIPFFVSMYSSGSSQLVGEFSAGATAFRAMSSYQFDPDLGAGSTQTVLHGNGFQILGAWPGILRQQDDTLHTQLNEQWT